MNHCFFVFIIAFFMMLISNDDATNVEWKWNETYIQMSDGAYIYSRVHNPHLIGNSEKVPLLFIHGFTASSTSFDRLLEDFGSSHHDFKHTYIVIEVDVRGHGQSQSYDVSTVTWTMDRVALDNVQVLQYYGIPKAIWVGMSMGGLITFHGAFYYPSFVDSLVIIASGPLPTAGTIAALLAIASWSCFDHFTSFYGTIEFLTNSGLSLNQALKVTSDQYKLGTTAAQELCYSLASADYSNLIIQQDVLLLLSYTDVAWLPEVVVPQVEAMSVGTVVSHGEFSTGHLFFLFETSDLITDFWDWLQN